VAKALEVVGRENHGVDGAQLDGGEFHRIDPRPRTAAPRRLFVAAQFVELLQGALEQVGRQRDEVESLAAVNVERSFDANDRAIAARTSGLAARCAALSNTQIASTVSRSGSLA
jgi:hypothetical protein